MQHISPYVGRHNGGLKLNVTGKGDYATATLLRHPRTRARKKKRTSSSLIGLRACIAGFLISTNPKCRFGAMEVQATVVSPVLIQCYTPVNTDFKPLTPYNAQDKTLECR